MSNYFDLDRKESVFFAAVSIAVFSFLAKILGVARDAIFSNQFGASFIIDAYFAAFRIPDFIFSLLILGTFSVAFIPIFSESIIKDKNQANKLASSILNLFLLVIISFCFYNKPYKACQKPHNLARKKKQSPEGLCFF